MEYSRRHALGIHCLTLFHRRTAAQGEHQYSYVGDRFELPMGNSYRNNNCKGLFASMLPASSTTSTTASMFQVFCGIFRDSEIRDQGPRVGRPTAGHCH